MYFIHNGNSQRGPFTLQELREQKISKDTLVWSEGMSDWQQADRIEELKPLFAATPPPLRTMQEKPERKRVPVWLFVVLISLAVFSALGVFLYNKTKDDAVEQTMQIQESQQMAEDEAKQEEQRKIEERKLYIRNHIDEFFDTKVNYSSSLLGGISDVTVHFYNNSEYPIDEAVVRVSYIKNNGAVWTTYDVTLRNTAANGSSTERADNSNRGTTVNIELISVRSGALQLCYNGVSPGVDPYFCR